MITNKIVSNTKSLNGFLTADRLKSFSDSLPPSHVRRQLKNSKKLIIR